MSTDPHSADRARGTLAAAASFLIWGVVPVYWKQMQAVPPFELIAHRFVWSLFFLLGLMWWQGTLGALRAAFAGWRPFGLNLFSTVLLTVNWTVYVWAVNSGHVIESSLGYFLVPLANVAMGFLLLHERLRPAQWAAIAFAVLGVGVLLLRAGHVPWIALILALTWAGYGLLKKKSALGPVAGLTVETLLLFPLAAGLLLWWHQAGTGALGRVDARLHAYILSIGVITSIPLVLFAYGAQRIRFVTLGLLQYVAPSVQFLIGWLVYREPFDAARAQAFGLIWAGLAVYSADSLWAQRRSLLKTVGA